MSYRSYYKSHHSSYHNNNVRHDGFRDLFEELQSQSKPQRESHYKDYSNCIKLRFRKKNTQEHFSYEGLVLESGAVLIGIDVWRLLNKIDIPSHEVDVFKNLDEALKKYRIFNI